MPQSGGAFQQATKGRIVSASFSKKSRDNSLVAGAAGGGGVVGSNWRQVWLGWVSTWGDGNVLRLLVVVVDGRLCG